MLRGRNEKESVEGGLAPYPTTNEPYAVEDHPMGIAFYRGKESFFLPYSLLETIRFQPDNLTLLFAPFDVAIEGRGLHSLYVQLAAQKVVRVVEQGERYKNSSDDVVFISRIAQIPKASAEDEPTR